MKLSLYSRFSLPVLCLCTCQWAFAALPLPVTQALIDAQIPESSVAIVVQSVTESIPALSHQGDVSMNPASVMKLLTTYSGLEALGPAYAWRTEAFTDGKLREGLLRGNLYIKGGGDPRLTVEQWWLFLKRIRAAGIRVIAGDVIIDTSRFAPIATFTNGFDDKPLRAYNVDPSALLINYNAVNINLSADSDGKQVHAWTEPAFSSLKFVNRLTLDSAPCGDWKERLMVTIDGNEQSRRLTLQGKFSINCGEKNYPLSLFDHENFVRGLFLDLWKEMGGKLDGRVRDGETPVGIQSVARLDSAPLSELIRDINKWSNNVMARQLYLTIGAETSGNPATLDKSREAIIHWLAAKGLIWPELVLENGSGLSRVERISASHLADLLLMAWRSPLMPEFMASLPIVAIDGTMRKRLKGNDAAGHGHIKTGTLDGVKTMAGYVQDKNGRQFIVVVFVNHPNAALAQTAEDALIAWIYDGRQDLPH